MNECQKVEDMCKKTTTLLHLLSEREVYKVYDKSLITLVSSEMLRDNPLAFGCEISHAYLSNKYYSFNRFNADFLTTVGINR